MSFRVFGGAAEGAQRGMNVVGVGGRKGGMRDWETAWKRERQIGVRCGAVWLLCLGRRLDRGNPFACVGGCSGPRGQERTVMRADM